MQLKTILNSDAFAVIAVLLAIYILFVAGRIEYVYRVRVNIWNEDENKYELLPGFFKMLILQPFKWNYEEEILGPDGSSYLTNKDLNDN
jgi:hypothetical protein